MGHAARKPGPQTDLKFDTEYDSSGVEPLDEAEVLKCLESGELHEYDLHAATGQIYGLVFGTLVWAIIGIAFFAAVGISNFL